MAQRLSNEPDRTHEAALWSRGFSLVAGVDEVGRGAWAGPVVAAAVVLPRDLAIDGIRDSKQLSKAKRQQMAAMIKKIAVGIGIGWAAPAEIDEFGLSRALALAGARALGVIDRIDAVILDGQHNYLPGEYDVTTIIRADGCCLNVAAASIIAKVARDNYMARVHQLHPEFGFDSNVGYGTKQHINQIKNGITPLHRRSFKPVKLAGTHGIN